MPITVDATALTTLASLKAVLGITGTTQDERLSLTINAASAAIENYCQTQFARATVTNERHPQAGSLRLVVKRVPVLSVTGITADGTALDISELIVESSKGGILYRPGGFPRSGYDRSALANRPLVGSETPDLLVTYEAGYVTPAQSDETGGDYDGDTVTLPAPLQMACVKLAASFYQDGNTAREVARESIDNTSIYYRPDGSDGEGIPSGLLPLLRAYRRVVFA